MTRALTGIRIVSTAINIPGPVAAALLRDMGAMVVKVEPPSGDPLSLAAPAWYAALVSGLDVLRVDLKTSGGRRTFEPLLGTADLVITASRPASLQRLGLSWPDLHRDYPRLCHVAIVGHPAPRDGVAGHDLTYQAEAGLLAPGAMPRTLTADLAGAQQAVIASLDLLLARERSGAAGTTTVSLVSAAALFAEPLRHRLTVADGPLGGALPAYNIYLTLDGSVALAALEPQFRSAVARELHVDIDDGDALAKAMLQKTSSEWEHWAGERGIPLAALRS
jgi:alpha-methylacyl-CoA racemase